MCFFNSLPNNLFSSPSPIVIIYRSIRIFWLELRFCIKYIFTTFACHKWCSSIHETYWKHSISMACHYHWNAVMFFSWNFVSMAKNHWNQLFIAILKVIMKWCMRTNLRDDSCSVSTFKPRWKLFHYLKSNNIFFNIFICWHINLNFLLTYRIKTQNGIAMLNFNSFKTNLILSSKC